MRSWSVAASAWSGLGLAVAVSLVGEAYVDVPGLHNRVLINHVLPSLAAVVLPFPLIDRTPTLTLMAARPPWRALLMRLCVVGAVAVPVVIALVSVGWTLAASLSVFAWLGVAAVACAALGQWFWAPTLLLGVVWLQWGPREWPYGAGLEWVAVDTALLLVGSLVYVVWEAGKIRRLTRGVGAVNGG